MNISHRSLLRLPTTAGAVLLASACASSPSSDETGGAALVDQVASAPVVGLAGKCLDDNAAGEQDGNKIQLWTCNASSAQAWTYAGGTLVGPGGKCLDVTGASTADGTPVELWTCNGGANQQWTFEGGQLVGIGGKCLDVTGFDSDDGTELQIWDCTGGDNQRWSDGGEGTGSAGAASGKSGSAGATSSAGASGSDNGAVGTSGSGPLSAVLGGYFFPNPGTGQTNPTFDEKFDEFTSEVGAPPRFMNTFVAVDDLSNVAGSQYWWSGPFPADTRTAPGSVTPVAAIPTATSWDGDTRLGQYNDVAAGVYDAQFTGAAQAWKDAGYGTAYFRIDWEMNGTFMAWNWVDGGDAMRAAGIASFRRAAQMLKSVPGINAQIAWNPAAETYTNYPVSSLYPGDDVVDVVCLDLYSYVGWSADLSDWNADGTAAATTSPDLKTWAANVNNRRHFWDSPGAWGWLDNVAFAQAHGKPIALCETGVGQNPGGPDTGLDDDPAFPEYLAERIAASPVPFLFLNVWSLNENDANDDFLRGAKPLTAAAWKKYFGSGT